MIQKIPTACTDLLTEWIQAVGYYRYRSVINYGNYIIKLYH